MQFKNTVAGLIAVSLVSLSGCATSDMQNIVGSGNAMSTSNKNLSATNLHS